MARRFLATEDSQQRSQSITPGAKYSPACGLLTQIHMKSRCMLGALAMALIAAGASAYAQPGARSAAATGSGGTPANAATGSPAGVSTGPSAIGTVGSGLGGSTLGSGLGDSAIGTIGSGRDASAIGSVGATSPGAAAPGSPCAPMLAGTSACESERIGGEKDVSPK